MDYIQDLYIDREASSERSLFQFQDRLNKVWEKKYKEANHINIKVKRNSYIRMCVSGLVTFLGYALAIGILCIFLVRGLVTYGMFVSIIITVLRLMYTLSYSLSWDIAEMGRARAFSEDLP